MTWSAWVGGSLLLVAVVAPALGAGRAVGRAWLPTWSGPQGWLVAVVVAAAIVIGTGQLLGAIGAFRPAAIVAGAVALSGAVAVVAARRAPSPAAVAEPGAHAPAERAEPATRLALLGAVAVVVGAWSSHTLESLRNGILAADSLWYHLPRAAHMAHTGWVTRLHHTAPEFPDAFHPSNAELVHALPMAMYGRDAVSPLVNLGWMALVLLAAWCVGRPSGRPELAALGAAAVLASPLVVAEGAGTAGNDIAAIFFLLAAVAIVLPSGGAPAQVAIAAVAAGLAISTKLTVVPAVAVLTLGVIWAAPRGERARRALTWGVPLVGFGAFWYLRNLVLVGSPLPSTNLPGFGHRSFRIVEDLGFSVADYLLDGEVWREWLLPGLRADFGWGWPLLVACFAGATVAALREREPLVRALGVLLPVSAAAYAVLPTTALGEPGEPVLFAGNVIYLVPALMVALAVLPTLRPLRSGLAARALLAVYALLVLLGASTSPLAVVAPGRGVVAVAAGALVVAVGLAAAHLRLGRPTLAAGALAGLAVVGVAGHQVTDRYLAERYGQSQLYRWAASVSGADVAIAGFAGQFPFYGPHLDNTVTYVGDRRANGEFHDLQDCGAWRRALRDGRFDHVVLRAERIDVTDRHLVWTRTDPAATEVLEAEGGFVFRFDPAVADPGC